MMGQLHIYRIEGPVKYALRPKHKRKLVRIGSRTKEAAVKRCYDMAKQCGACELYRLRLPAEYQPYNSPVISKIAEMKIR